MTIFVQPINTVPEVMRGFVNRLRFRFYPFHDGDDTLLYELLGPYDIAVDVQPSRGDKIFIGRGHLILLDANSPDSREQINNVVGSQRARQMPNWEVQIELTRGTVGEIDAARRPSGDVPVQFVFDWHLWVRERRDESGGPRYGATTNERVVQRLGPSSYTWPTVSIATSEWFKLTEAHGFPSRRFIELVFPTVDKDRWTGAVNDLAQADRDFDSRRDPQAMDFCERAFEEVLGKKVVMGRPDEAKAAIEDLLKTYGIVDQGKREMLVNLVHDAVVFIRRGKHNVDAAGHAEFNPNSGDAELGLLVTKALIGFLSKQQD